MRRLHWIGIVAVAAALGGCANTGLQEEPGISDTFSVAADYQAAYRRAIEYVRVCHEGRKHRYGTVYLSSRELGVRDAPNTLRIHKRGEPLRILEVIQSAMDGPSSSKVTVTVLGTAPWDKDELTAARRSIETATPVCRALE